MPVTRNFLLKPTDPLLTAFQRVSANGEGFAAVVDDDRKLLGTFCDADGRHALLEGVSLGAPISDVMVSKTAKLSRLPGAFVLEKNEPVDVVKRERPPIDAVVMAGGKGTRLRSVTGNVPKPLLSLGASTILERILANMASAGVSDVWLSVNYRAASFKKKIGDGSKLGLNVEYLDEDEPLGNAGALSMLPRKGANQVFITNADLITGVDYARMFDFHRSHDAPITMAAARFVTKLKYGVVHTRKGVVDSMDEKPELEFLCNAGMYIVDRAALKLVPKKKFFQMPDLIDAVQRRSEDVRVFPLWEKWVDAGSPEEFQQVLIEFATGVES
ncbi:MAG: sugar phosphate nucleotidyltransferase [Acidimicrobiales bacterium]|nr:sugar phosphate nucleotidyltransferase [Acidimicrobiales bacterium]